MDLLPKTSPYEVFSSTHASLDDLDKFSRDSLAHGIDLYIAGDYKGAIREFQRSIGLSPSSQYAVPAASYMANAYVKLGDTGKAISTYQKAIKLNPTNDSLHISLGHLYFGLDRFAEAEQEYRKAVKINPSAENLFSHGNGLLSLDRFSDAEAVFSKVRQMEPEDKAGDYGLGLTYSRMGLYERAAEHFEAAVSLDKEFYSAYAEMGYAYMDMGDKEKAMEMVDILAGKDASLAYTLSQYIYQNDAPNFSVAYYAETFGGFPAKTPVSSLDSYLQNADASKIFTLKISFDKEMDRTSVENPANWRIYRSTGSGPGEAYNYGMAIPETEVNFPALPVNVYYDAETWTATVKFRITQNGTADGTIDPAHVEFKFMGKDYFGNTMDPTGDQYSAFSGIA